MLRHLDLFAGIGGFSLAASWTGKVEPAGFCEIDDWCRRVLAKHWPGVPQHDDIHTLSGAALDRFGRIDLITGGYPCQPFSVAGFKRGKEDDRYLWPEMARVVAESRPRYVLVENSPNIRTLVLDDMYDDLEGMGYSVRAAVIPACALNNPQRRDRMWTWACLDGDGESPGAEGGDETGDRAGDMASPPRSDITGERREEQRQQGDAEPELAPTQRCIGWPSGPGILRTVHGVSRRVDRIRGLGNAIVPQVAFEVMNAMFADVVVD